MSHHARLVILITMIFCASPFALADQAEHESGGEHEGSHVFHPNTLGLFVGWTDEGREEGFTLGLEFERRFSESFGIGVVAEHVFGDLDFWIVAVPFAYHHGPWKLYVAPGVEDAEDGEEYLTRVGAEYAFEVGQWEIAPQFNVDFVDNEEVFVLGFMIGKGF